MKTPAYLAPGLSDATAIINPTRESNRRPPTNGPRFWARSERNAMTIQTIQAQTYTGTVSNCAVGPE
jgi:hypothetical protein